MQLRHLLCAALAAGGLSIPGPALAADPAPQPAAPAYGAPTHSSAPPGGVVGADTMGDKNRSGPDGWVQAPITRDQAPAQRAQAAGEGQAQQSASTGSTPNRTPGGSQPPPLPPGQDPGTPVAAEPAGPGALDSAAAPKR